MKSAVRTGDVAEGGKATENRSIITMKVRLLLPAAVLFVLVSSCSGSGSCSYLRTSDVLASGDGVFWFDAFLSDTISYTTGVAMRYYDREMPSDRVEFDVYVVSPLGDKYIERVELPLFEVGDGLVRQYPATMGGIREIEWIYRRHIRVDAPDAGLWRIGVEPVGEQLWTAIQGLGFFSKEE